MGTVEPMKAKNESTELKYFNKMIMKGNRKNAIKSTCLLSVHLNKIYPHVVFFFMRDGMLKVATMIIAPSRTKQMRAHSIAISSGKICISLLRGNSMGPMDGEDNWKARSNSSQTTSLGIMFDFKRNNRIQLYQNE